MSSLAVTCATVLILLPSQAQAQFYDYDSVPVDTSLGEAGATSVLWNNEKFSADYAFKNMSRLPLWAKEKKHAPYTIFTWNSYGWVNESAPQTVYIRLAEPVTVLRFSFRSGSGSSWNSNWTPWAPTKFELVGSADCENWTVLKSVEGENWTKKDERKEWNVQSDAFYKCLGIRTLQTKNNHVAIHDLKFYKDLVRQDGKCGPQNLIDGKTGQCNPYGNSPCCSEDGYCGITVDDCKGIDYRVKDLVREDGRCGPDFPNRNGKPGQCSPYGDSGWCCSPHEWDYRGWYTGGWCGSTWDHCKCADCIDYRKEPKL